jgi:hypothetical protein
MDIKTALKNATTVNEALITCDEAEAQALLKAELRGARRRSITIRIFSRFNRMRAARERAEILEKL